MPVVHFFLIEVSYNAVTSGALEATCSAIARVLDELQGMPLQVLPSAILLTDNLKNSCHLACGKHTRTCRTCSFLASTGLRCRNRSCFEHLALSFAQSSASGLGTCVYKVRWCNASVSMAHSCWPAFHILLHGCVGMAAVNVVLGCRKRDGAGGYCNI